MLFSHIKMGDWHKTSFIFCLVKPLINVCLITCHLLKSLKYSNHFDEIVLRTIFVSFQISSKNLKILSRRFFIIFHYYVHQRHTHPSPGFFPFPKSHMSVAMCRLSPPSPFKWDRAGHSPACREWGERKAWTPEWWWSWGWAKAERGHRRT